MRYFLFVTLCLASLTATAHDKIHKKGGEVIMARILEIGVDEVKYKLFAEPDGPSYGIEKDRIIRIEFENGRTESYKSNLKDPELYTGQSRNAIKINFLSPLFGHTQLGYERSLKPGRSLEFTASLIGLGRHDNVDMDYYDPVVGYTTVKRNAGGLGLGVGYKFIRTPDFINRSIRYAHLLQGTYIKPVFYTGVYGENYVVSKGGTYEKKKETTVFGALNIELGKQWVFSELFVVDLYGGIGYAVDNITDRASWNGASDEYQAHHFTVLRTMRSPGLALSGGLKIGLMLNSRK